MPRFYAPLLRDWNAVKAALRSLVTRSRSSSRTREVAEIDEPALEHKLEPTETLETSHDAPAPTNELDHFAMEYEEADHSENQFDMNDMLFNLIFSMLGNKSRGVLSIQQVSEVLEQQDAELYAIWLDALKDSDLIDISKLPSVEYYSDYSMLLEHGDSDDTLRFSIGPTSSMAALLNAPIPSISRKFKKNDNKKTVPRVANKESQIAKKLPNTSITSRSSRTARLEQYKKEHRDYLRHTREKWLRYCKKHSKSQQVVEHKIMFASLEVVPEVDEEEDDVVY